MTAPAYSVHERAQDIVDAWFEDTGSDLECEKLVATISDAFQELVSERDAALERRDYWQRCRDREHARAETLQAKLDAFDVWGKPAADGRDYRAEFNEWVKAETNVETLRARLIAADEGGDYMHMCHSQQQARANALEAKVKQCRAICVDDDDEGEVR